MGDFLGNIGRKMLKVVKRMLKHAVMATAPIWGILLIILLILAALTYENTMQEGTKQEGSWQSTPFVATQYSANIEIQEDGTIVSETTPQELWDEMIKHDNEIRSYLSNSKEFAKLLHAEQITNFPDTRSDPSEEINWDDIINPKSNRIQGIIKFKRETGGANPTDLVYVDYGTFMDWLEGYNLTGNETLREQLLTHFTIGKNIVQAQNNSQNASLNYTEGDVWTDISEAIVRATSATETEGGGYCQAWVDEVYVNAGLPSNPKGSAYIAFKENYISTDRNNIPIGAAVYSTGSKYLSNGDPNIYGHVGIYVGDIDNDGIGEVKDDIGYIRTIDLSEWIAEAENQGNTQCVYNDVIETVTPGFLGWGWQSGSPTRELTEKEIEKLESEDLTSSATVPVTEEAANTSTQTSYYAIVATWTETTVDGVTSSSMTTQNINYQDYVSQFTMPFDYLWALIVTGRDRKMALELVDLVLDSQIEITVHDNLTTTTDRTTTTTNVYEYNEETGENELVSTNTTSTETITKSNTLNIGLTKADVWIVNYTQEFDYTGPQLISENTTTETITNGTITRYNKVESQKYISIPAVPQPKVEKGKDQYNFVTIFMDDEYYQARNSILSAPDWLFNILARNDSTKDMVDLTKYLLYKATGNDYGVTDYDFSVFEPNSFTSTGITAGNALAEFLKSYENEDLRTYMNGSSNDYGSVSNYVSQDRTQYRLYYTSFDNCYNFTYGIMVSSDEGLNNESYFADEGLDLQALVNRAQNGEDVYVDVEIIDRIFLNILNDKKNALKETLASRGVSMESYQLDALTSVAYQYGNCGQYYSGSENIGELYKTYYQTGAIEEFKNNAHSDDGDGGRNYFFIGSNYKDRKEATWTLFHEGKYILADGTEVKGNSSEVVQFALQFVGENHSRFTSYRPTNGVTNVWFQDNWCAMFVSYCFNECGLIPSVLPRPYAACGLINDLYNEGNPRVKIVGNMGVFAGVSKDNYIPSAGDIIFFNWGDANVASHTVIVVNCDGSKVYTVEGNSGGSWSTSTVQEKEYSLDSSSIVGYISMNG